MTTVKKEFLLITGLQEDIWGPCMVEALSSLGEVQVACEVEALECVKRADYALVIVDTTFATNMTCLVSELRKVRPQLRIVVATASPTWKRAREAFQVGAIDYIRKSLDKDEILSIVNMLLTRLSPKQEIR